MKPRIEAVVNIQTHGGHSLGRGPPDSTMAQKLHVEPLPSPSQAAPNLKVPCKKLNFHLAPSAHTALSPLRPSDSQLDFHTHPCIGIQLPPAKTAPEAVGPGASTKREVQRAGLPTPALPRPTSPTAQQTAGRRPVAPRMERRQSCKEAAWNAHFRMCKCGTHRAQPRPHRRPGRLRLTCSFR